MRVLLNDPVGAFFVLLLGFMVLAGMGSIAREAMALPATRIVTWDLAETDDFEHARDLAAHGWEPFGFAYAYSQGHYCFRRRR